MAKSRLEAGWPTHPARRKIPREHGGHGSDALELAGHPGLSRRAGLETGHERRRTAPKKADRRPKPRAPPSAHRKAEDAAPASPKAVPSVSATSKAETPLPLNRKPPGRLQPRRKAEPTDSATPDAHAGRERLRDPAHREDRPPRMPSRAPGRRRGRSFPKFRNSPITSSAPEDPRRRSRRRPAKAEAVCAVLQAIDRRAPMPRTGRTPRPPLPPNAEASRSAAPSSRADEARAEETAGPARRWRTRLLRVYCVIEPTPPRPRRPARGRHGVPDAEEERLDRVQLSS